MAALGWPRQLLTLASAMPAGAWQVVPAQTGKPFHTWTGQLGRGLAELKLYTVSKCTSTFNICQLILLKSKFLVHSCMCRIFLHTLAPVTELIATTASPFHLQLKQVCIVSLSLQPSRNTSAVYTFPKRQLKSTSCPVQRPGHSHQQALIHWPNHFNTVLLLTRLFKGLEQLTVLTQRGFSSPKLFLPET